MNVMNEIKRLYMEIFGDSQALADQLFVSTYTERNLRLLTSDEGEVESFLFAFPRILRLGKVDFKTCFLSAVATPSKFRGQGKMKENIVRFMGEARESGVTFLSLCPAKEDYYKSLGFVTVVKGRKRKLSFSGEEVRLKVVDNAKEFGALYDEWVREKDVYIDRDKEFFERTFLVHKAENNKIYQILDGNKSLGYFVDDEECIYEYSCDISKLLKVPFLDRKSVIEYGEGNSRYMVRLLNPERLLDGLKCTEKFQKTLIVRDEILGEQKIGLRCDGERIKTCAPVGNQEEIDIVALTEWVFSLLESQNIGKNENCKIALCDLYL